VDSWQLIVAGRGATRRTMVEFHCLFSASGAGGHPTAAAAAAAVADFLK